MEGKSSEDQPIQENLGQGSDNTENEMLSEGAAATKTTELNDKAAADGKPEPSPIISEPTSGLEMVSRSTTSDSEIPYEGETSDAEKKPEPSPLLSEPTSGIELISRSTTSDSEIPCEGGTSDAEKKPEPSPLLSEPTSGIELISRSSTSASEIPCEGTETSDTEKKPEPTTLSLDPTVELESTSVPSEGTTNVEKNADVTSTPPKKSFVGQFVSGVKGLLSPPKSGKSKANRSKSMSPSKPQSTDSDDSKPVSEEACPAQEREEYSKKGNEDGVIRKLKRKLSKFKLGGKSSESANLVSNEETDRTEERKPSKLDNLPEPVWSEMCMCECPSQWTDGSSATDRTYDGTTMTDIPSTCSGTDVFPSDSSKKSSEMGENTSEEAVAGSLVSSPDEIPDIKKDKDAECIKKDGSSTDQNTQNVVAAEKSKESQCTTKDDPSIGKETLNVVADEHARENQSIGTDGPSTDSITNISVDESTKESQSTSNDDPSTAEETNNEVAAENSKEKQPTAKDSESREGKD